ncbi:MAG: YdeI/OmpD-associated family protein [Bacteroidota bacterium]|nr:YdeI/OmpD-associated family protein [Bacteroidota bacterium]MDP4195219.1 YdeI/OmpD-associated family protein [Bacteroidota bacterium]
MEALKTLHVTTAKEWRAWLKKNHLKENVIWLVFYKQSANKPILPLEDAIGEALCYGWIDSIIKKIDEERYVRKFTPRTNKNKWSEVNKARVRELIKEGRMTEFGLSKVTFPLEESSEDKLPTQKKKVLDIPPFLEKALKADALAWKNFNNLAPSYRRIYLLWITSAKKEETMAKRVAEAVELLRQNKKLEGK